MSNATLPDLPGMDISVTKTPAFSTKIQSSVSGHEARAAFQAYPLWTFSLAYNVLRAGAERELQALVGFFLARRGAWDSFLFVDPTDNAVADQVIGTGNGTIKQFQLIRTFGYGAGATFDEPVHNPINIGNIKVGGVVTSAYTIDNKGLITFTTAPGAGKAVTWSGTFAYRCRFTEDEVGFNRFLYDLWEASTVGLIGSPMNKV